MKLIKYILPILLISCASVAPVKKTDTLRSKPSLTTGCDSYKGRERSDCIGKGMLKDYENLRNSKRVDSKVDEYRKDEKYIVEVFESCRVYNEKKLLCDPLEEREKYDPTFMYFVYDILIKGVPGVIIGFLARGGV